MVMALSVLYLDGRLTVLVGYESGHVMVTQYVEGEDWRVRYLSQPHSQPVLGLDVLPDKKAFYTTSADANVVKHPLAALPTSQKPTAPVMPSHPPTTISHPPGTGGLSAQFAALSSSSDTAQPPQPASVHEAEIITTPLKIAQTKHSGQQGVRVRDDGKIFATAGWDGRVRVYSCKTLQELAVLKWHREGVFAVAFAGVVPLAEEEGDKNDQEEREQRASESEGGAGTEVALRGSGTLAVRRQREEKIAKTHWVAAGSKDGKVSLWEIY
jgi:WD40 repeat protein